MKFFINAAFTIMVVSSIAQDLDNLNRKELRALADIHLQRLDSLTLVFKDLEAEKKKLEGSLKQSDEKLRMKSTELLSLTETLNDVRKQLSKQSDLVNSLIKEKATLTGRLRSSKDSIKLLTNQNTKHQQELKSNNQRIAVLRDSLQLLRQSAPETAPPTTGKTTAPQPPASNPKSYGALRTRLEKMIRDREPLFTTGESNEPLRLQNDGVGDEPTIMESYNSMLRAINRNYGDTEWTTDPMILGTVMALHPIYIYEPGSGNSASAFEQPYIPEWSSLSESGLILICTVSPFPGIDYQNLEKYFSTQESTNSLVYVSPEEAFSYGEISYLPRELSGKGPLSLDLTYRFWNATYPNRLTLQEFLAYATHRYTYIDEFQRKALQKKWTDLVTRETTTKNTEWIAMQKTPTVFTGVFYMDEFDEKKKQFIVRNTTENGYQPVTEFHTPKTYYENREFRWLGLEYDAPFRVSSPLAFTLFQNDLGFRLLHKTTGEENQTYSNKQLTFIVKSEESAALKISRMLGANRSIYCRIKAMPKLAPSTDFCNACKDGNCNESNMYNYCMLYFNCYEYEFSGYPDFRESVVVR